MFIKLIFLALAGYLAYTYFIRPKTLQPGQQQPMDQEEDEYVDYEEVKDE